MVPELSVVIVNYNGGQLIEACLESLFAEPPAYPFEVIVVDNASTDGSPGLVQRFEDVRLIRNEENLGLAVSFNQGLKQARGRYVLSLDNDTRVLPRALTNLVEFCDSNPDAGAVGSRLFDPDMTPQSTARRAPSAINALLGRRSLLTRWFPNNPISRRYLMTDLLDADQAHEVDWLSTAALMVRREVLDSVGGLDEGFFVYWVDADWCARIRAGGFKVFVVPQSKIIHDENLRGQRPGKRSKRMVIDFHRGAYRYYRRHHLRSAWSPMGLLTLAGLATRAGLLIAADSLRSGLRSVVQASRGHA